MRPALPGYLPEASAPLSRHGTRNGIDRAPAVIARAIICISFVFMIFPAIDLAVSHGVAEGSVFVLAQDPFLKAVRKFGLRSPVWILSLMLMLILAHRFLPRRHAICRPHKPLFVLMSFAAGPLLIAETLKPLIGRARPRQLIEFGGAADFTPVWQFSAACARNCSFPSGEAAGAAAALSLLVFVPVRLRWIAALILVPALMMIAGNRVLFGAHFLSDVVLAWLFTMLAMAWIWRWMQPRAARIDRALSSARP